MTTTVSFDTVWLDPNTDKTTILSNVIGQTEIISKLITAFRVNTVVLNREEIEIFLQFLQDVAFDNEQVQVETNPKPLIIEPDADEL